jgi:hypothetical protein
MRFVRLCSDLGGCFRTPGFDGCSARRFVVARREFVWPRPVFRHVPFDICVPIGYACTRVMSRALVVHLAADPLERVGSWTIGRHPEPMNAGMVRQPLFDGLRLLDTGGVHDAIDASHPWGGLHVVHSREEVPPQGLGCARATVLHPLPCRELEGTGSRWLGRLAWGPHDLLHTVGAPGLADVGPQRAIACLRPTPHVSPRQGLAMQPDAGQPLDPWGSGIVGHPLGPFPDPVERAQPAS